MLYSAHERVPPFWLHHYMETDFKKWTELAQDRAGWQKLIYQSSNGAVPPPDTARRNVTHVPPANYCMFFDGSTELTIGHGSTKARIVT